MLAALAKEEPAPKLENVVVGLVLFSSCDGSGNHLGSSSIGSAFCDSSPLCNDTTDFGVGVYEADVELTDVAAWKWLFAAGTEINNGSLLAKKRRVLLLLLLHGVDGK